MSPRTTRLQLAKFGLVGLASNALLYLIYLALTAVDIEPKLAMSVVYVVGVMQTYFANRCWTFDGTRSREGTAIRYGLTYVSGYAVNWLALWILVDRLGWAHQIVQAGMILVVAMLMFAMQKFWVFAARAA